VTCLLKKRHQCRADESCRTRYGDFHEWKYKTGLALFSVTFEGAAFFVILAGIVEVGFADSRVTIYTLLAFFLGHLRSSNSKWRKQQCNTTEYRYSSDYLAHFNLLTAFGVG
jgi:hypothetical protein